MSLFSYPIGREAPIKEILATTVATTIYTAGNNGATILALRITEATSATGQGVIVAHHDGTSSYATHRQALSANQTFEPVRLDSIPIVLAAGETLRITPTSVSAIHVTGVVIEPPTDA